MNDSPAIARYSVKDRDMRSACFTSRPAALTSCPTRFTRRFAASRFRSRLAPPGPSLSPPLRTWMRHCDTQEGADVDLHIPRQVTMHGLPDTARFLLGWRCALTNTGQQVVLLFAQHATV